MNRIGKRIYYDVKTGEVVFTTSERQGAVIATTIEQDIATFTALSERNRETFDVIELQFGYRAQDFAECDGYRVNPETKELEFIHVDEETPVEEGEPGVPLTDQIEALEAQYMYDSMMKDMEIDSLSAGQAELMYQLMMKGVL